MKKKTLLLWILFVSSTLCTFAQNSLKSGPMLGDVQMISASIWAQFANTDRVYCVYYERDATEEKSFQIWGTPNEKFGHTCVFELNDLKPNTVYEYYINDKQKKYTFTTQALWQWRTDAPDFTMALGSCTYINETEYDRPGKAYGDGYGIFTRIAEKKPNLMLWMGDNIYLREPDWSSLGGIVRRYTHTRSCPELQTLLQACPNYAIWDDHDFGPNDADGSFIHKDWTLEAFQHFWANPSYGLPDSKGITTQFTHSDVEFFLLDNRYHKVAPNVDGMKSTILGNAQIEWLIQALKASKATFKLVAIGGQFLNTVSKFENYATVSEERQRIIDLITSNSIPGVVFLSGDRHCTELSALPLSNGYTLYDLTVSPLTSGPYDMSAEENTLRVKGTVVGERNFATLSFQGKKGERTMTIRVFDQNGQEKWNKTIAQEMKK
jgi:alkaline phosphatase D